MEAKDNDPAERACMTSTEPLNDMILLEQALKDDCTRVVKTRPAIIRYWNKKDVDRIREDYSETITIRATCPRYNDERELSISKGLLCHFSPYFRAALMGQFIESTQKILDIDLRPSDAGVFSTWLSSGKLYCRKNLHPYVLGYSMLVRLYTFADYYDIPALRRAIMLKIASPYECERLDTHISEWQLGSCLAELPTTSPFYQWMVEHWAHCNTGRLGRNMRQNEEVPEEFRDLVLNRRSNNLDGRSCKCCRNPCDYHEHESEEEWAKTCLLLNKDIPKPDPSTYRKPSRAL